MSHPQEVLVPWLNVGVQMALRLQGQVQWVQVTDVEPQRIRVKLLEPPGPRKRWRCESLAKETPAMLVGGSGDEGLYCTVSGGSGPRITLVPRALMKLTDEQAADAEPTTTVDPDDD